MKPLSALALAALLAFLLAGCRTRLAVAAVTTTARDTVRVTRVARDSVYVRDSVHVHSGGDTVRVERWHYETRDVVRSDTLWRTRVDSVPVPVPVERALTRWQRLRLDWGGWAMAACLLMPAAWLVLRRLRKAG